MDRNFKSQEVAMEANQLQYQLGGHLDTTNTLLALMVVELRLLNEQFVLQYSDRGSPRCPGCGALDGHAHHESCSQ